MPPDRATVILDRIIGRLHRHAPRSRQAQPELAMTPGHPWAPRVRARVFEVQLHLNGRILEQQRGWFNQNALHWRERADEGISAGVQQEQPWLLRCGEAIHEHAERVMRLGVVAIPGGEPDAGLKPVVADMAGRDEKEVLAYIDR